MTPAGLLQHDAGCDGCGTHHTDVWWTVRDDGRFRAYCAECWPRKVGVYAQGQVTR